MLHTKSQHPRVRLRALIALGLLSALLPGCRNISIKPEATRTEQIAKELTDEHIPLLEPNVNFDELLQNGITRDGAIRTALLNNKSLQAAFQELGIAKADLVQAGLLKNPSVATSFNIPRSGKAIVTNIELEAPIISLTELWQIPLRKKAFSAQLEVAISRFVHLLFETMVNTRKAFDRVLFAEALLKNAQETWEQMKALRDDIFDRQDFGFSSDLDKYFSEVIAGTWELKVTILTADVANAYTNLSYLLGLDPALHNSLKVTEPFFAEVFIVPELDCILDWAAHNHPEIRLAQKKIAYYTDLIRYEKSRVFKEIDMGIAFKQDFDPQQRGIGPYLNAEIPLFDQNQARIAHAEFSLKKAEREYTDTQLRIKSEVITQYKKFTAFRTNIALYTNKLTGYNKKAIDYTVKFQKQMQITIPTLILTKTELYKTQRRLLKTYYNALTAYAELEKAVGKRLSSFLASAKI